MCNIHKTIKSIFCAFLTVTGSISVYASCTDHSVKAVKELQQFCKDKDISWAHIDGIFNIMCEYLEDGPYRLQKILPTGLHVSQHLQSLQAYENDKQQLFVTCHHNAHNSVIWNSQNKTYEEIPGSQGSRHAALSSEGTHLAFVANNTLTILNLLTKTRTTTPPHLQLSTWPSLQFATDDSLLAVTDLFKISLWKPYLEPSELIAGCCVNHNDTVPFIYRFSIHPKNTSIAILIKTTNAQRVSLWRKPFEANLPQTILTQEKPYDKGSVIRFSPDGNHILIGDDDGNLHIYTFTESSTAEHYASHKIFTSPASPVTHLNVSQTHITVGSAGYPRIATFYMPQKKSHKRQHESEAQHLQIEKTPVISTLANPLNHYSDLSAITQRHIISSHDSGDTFHVYGSSQYDIEPSSTITEEATRTSLQRALQASLSLARARPQPQKTWWQRVFSNKNIVYGLRACSAALGLGSGYLAHKHPEHAHVYGPVAAAGIGGALWPSLYHKYQTWRKR